MPKNTFVLVTILAIIASLLIGFNFGKRFQNASSAIPTPTLMVSPTPTPMAMTPYTDTYCKIALSYPSSMTVTEGASGSAKFSSDTENVVLGCQRDIPGIAVEEKNRETIHIGSISGTLYHTATPKDGTPIEVFIITHPKTGMDILVSGIGSTFDAIIRIPHAHTMIPDIISSLGA